MHRWFECLSTFRYYNWTLAAPLILSLQAFQKNLPKVKLSQVCHIHNSFSANLFSNLCCFTRFWLPRLQRRLGWRRKCKRNQAAGGSGVRGRTVQSSRYASMEKKKAGKTQSQTQTFQYIFSSQISQSETKHETKEESQLEEEGAAILQDKLSLQ